MLPHQVEVDLAKIRFYLNYLLPIEVAKVNLMVKQLERMLKYHQELREHPIEHPARRDRYQAKGES